MADENEEPKVELIRMAQGLAEIGSGGGVSAEKIDRYLERFRAIYDHLAATVFTTTAAGRDRRGDASTPPWD